MNWLGYRVRHKRTGEVGTVTADMPDTDHDVLAVDFGPGQWNSYHPNAWSKEHLFELIDIGSTDT